MAPVRLLLTSVLVASALAAGCKSDVCKPTSPGFELVVVAGAHATEIRSLEVAVVNGADKRKKVFDVGAERTDGQTSLWIALDPAPTGDFTVAVYVAAYDRAGGQGTALVNGSHAVSGSATSCNRFELRLADPASDAGIVPGPDATTDAGDAGENVDPDATVPDTGVPDTSLPDTGVRDTGIPDTGLVDSGVNGGIDAGTPDSGAACADTPDVDTVALYRFQSNLADETGSNPGTLGGMNVTYSSGRASCGSALTFPQASSLQGWARIPTSLDFDLPEGSIDLWVDFGESPPFGSPIGVVSRDAMGTGSDGQFTLYASCEGYLVAKLEAGGVRFFQCTDAMVVQDTWHYVLVNFGPPGLEVWLDGAQGTRTGTLHLGDGCAIPITCGTSTDQGLDGNDNAWILGASSDLSTDGLAMPTPLHLPMRRGKIDSLRISSIRR